MSLDELLRSAAAEVAGRVSPPGVDPDELRARARRTSRRRGALAAVLAVVTGVAFLLTRADVHRAAPAPSSPPTTLRAPRDAAVWADGRGIHVGDRTFAPAAQPASLTLVADGVVYKDRTGRVWFQALDGSSPDPVGWSAGWSAPVGAADGTTVAWAVPTRGGDWLTLYDASSGHVLSRILVAGGGDTWVGGDRVPNPGPFFYVDPQRVIYNDGPGIFAFDRSLGQAVRLVDDQLKTVSSRFAGDLLRAVDAAYDLRVVEVCCATNPSRAPLAAVDDRGRVLAWLGTAEPSGVLNHDGTLFAGVVDTSRRVHHAEVVDVATGRRHRLTAGTTLATRVGWGYGDVLMVRESGDNPASEGARPRLLQCHMNTQTCTPVDLPGGSAGVVLPTS